jgi:tryptophan synthase beta chain
MSEKGFFGDYGGRYVAEVLRQPLERLEMEFEKAMADPEFLADLEAFSREYIGRPTPLLPARNASAAIGGADIYIKIEGLANTGAHKINNAAGQALLAKRMGKKRIIAETGAGQHGVATAAACARLGLECLVYMGEEDIRRQHPNVYWMELFGAEVRPVSSGSRTLKDAVNAALRDWASSWEDTHYLLGSALGPSPYPDMVREFQAVIGRETREQLAAAVPGGVEPDALVACVGGGSNAIGFFEPWLEGSSVSSDGDKPCGDSEKMPACRPILLGAEAGGRGPGEGNNAARMTGDGRVGVVQGYKSRFLTDEEGQVLPTHSISAGLDYPGIGPQLAHLGESGRIRFVSVRDDEALDALKFFAREEGLIFAMESAHAGAAAIVLARNLGPGKTVVVNMSGRGDKDIFISAAALDGMSWRSFLKEESEQDGGAGDEGSGEAEA